MMLGTMPSQEAPEEKWAGSLRPKITQPETIQLLLGSTEVFCVLYVAAFSFRSR